MFCADRRRRIFRGPPLEAGRNSTFEIDLSKAMFIAKTQSRDFHLYKVTEVAPNGVRLCRVGVNGILFISLDELLSDYVLYKPTL